MNIINNIVKYLILLVAVVAITLLTTFIPIRGIELTQMSDLECDIRAAGLPFSFISKFIDDQIKRPARCYEPQPLDVPSTSTVLKNLAFIAIPFLLDIVFWAVFLAAASKLIGKFLNFLKMR